MSIIREMRVRTKGGGRVGLVAIADLRDDRATTRPAGGKAAAGRGAARGNNRATAVRGGIVQAVPEIGWAAGHIARIGLKGRPRKT
jgi:hypothetical protein